MWQLMQVTNGPLVLVSTPREGFWRRLVRKLAAVLRGLSELPEGGPDSNLTMPMCLYDCLTAHKRSCELLESWLEPRQLVAFRRFGRFEVRGGQSGRLYRLHARYIYGIEDVETGECYCVLPVGAPALGDILLAQKIGLERAEETTLSVANRQASRVGA